MRPGGGDTSGTCSPACDDPDDPNMHHAGGTRPRTDLKEEELEIRIN